MSVGQYSIWRSSLILSRASANVIPATSRSIISRHASVAASTPSTGQSNPFDSAEDEESDAPRRGRPKVSFRSWLETRGIDFREPKPTGTTWLGKGKAPFPLNPSFKPPTPTSDQVRQAIFDAHVRNPEVATIRHLSNEFGLSLKRVEAIIRLKGLEVKWRMDNRPLRLNFQKGMESTLGIRFALDTSKHSQVRQYTRSDTHIGDLVADETLLSSETKAGIEKIWWEGVEDGKEAIVGPHLAELAEKRSQRAAQVAAASAQFAASHSHVVQSTVPGRCPTVFVDIGLKFLNPKDEAKRQKEAAARKRLKTKKASRNTSAVRSSIANPLLPIPPATTRATVDL